MFRSRINEINRIKLLSDLDQGTLVDIQKEISEYDTTQSADIVTNYMLIGSKDDSELSDTNKHKSV